ncbi:MAG: ParA family protein [Gammaproteobacteria bacterium]
MKIWVSANQKGGVGKTTTAVSLAGCLLRQQSRVLLVDLDPHGSLSAYFGFDPDVVEGGVHGLFERAAGRSHVPLASLIHRTRLPNLTIAPASTALAVVERQFGAREGIGRVLGGGLGAWAGQFDHAIVDCPPMLGILLVNALACCDRVIVPVQTEPLALKGYERFMRTLQMVTRSRGQPIPYTVVPTMYDRRTRASQDALAWLEDNAGPQLWRGVVPVDTRFRDASRLGLPLPWHDPASRGACAYADLLDFLTQGASEAPNLRLAG